jgi:hypothetical protein
MSGNKKVYKNYNIILRVLFNTCSLTLLTPCTIPTTAITTLREQNSPNHVGIIFIIFPMMMTSRARLQSTLFCPLDPFSHDILLV